jgi:AcrR family transcriptional regulator
MPKVVNKALRREQIAISCTKLLIKKGFNKLTVSQIATNAKIAKGTIYEYFKTKEEIVFAIIEYAQQDYDKEILSKINSTNSIKEKILHLFSLCIQEDKKTIEKRKLYKEFISICLNYPSVEMIEFQRDIKNKYTAWLRDILEQGVKEKQLKPQALEFANGLFALGEAFLLFSQIDNYFDQDMLINHIDSLFELIEK